MLKIRKMILPESLWPTRSPNKMSKPIGVTFHNTWGTGSALAEATFMRSNPRHVSYHYAVDDVEAIQCLPEDRHGWHSGDGYDGDGNRKTIGIECCYSKLDRDIEKFKKAEQNSAVLIALLMKKYNWNMKDNFFIHQDWSGKYCPHRTLDMGLARFKKMVQAEIDKLNAHVQKPNLPVIVRTTKALPVREFPNASSKSMGTAFPSRYTIVNIESGWGKLKSGMGWIDLSGVSYLDKSTIPGAPMKTIAQVAKDVVNGKYGNGINRVKLLSAEGYDPSLVQKEVNRLVGKVNLTDVAMDVLKGKYGNGDARVARLKKAGYDASAVQKEVNRILAKGV